MPILARAACRRARAQTAHRAAQVGSMPGLLVVGLVDHLHQEGDRGHGATWNGLEKRGGDCTVAGSRKPPSKVRSRPMPQIRLHKDEADGGLPMVCMRCGEPATVTRTRN